MVLGIATVEMKNFAELLCVYQKIVVYLQMQTKY